MAKQTLELTVNGVKHSATAHPMARLLDVLREELKLTGTKEGCGEGECGACSVLLDGELVNSCLVPFAQVGGSVIATIEGVAAANQLGEPSAPALHPVQTAFLRCGGAQCGICTPGMIMATCHLLKENKNPSLEQIREGLAGNLCRCTGYTKIFQAVLEAAEQ